VRDERSKYTFYEFEEAIEGLFCNLNEVKSDSGYTATIQLLCILSLDGKIMILRNDSETNFPFVFLD